MAMLSYMLLRAIAALLLPSAAFGFFLTASPAGLWHAWVLSSDNQRVAFRLEVTSGWSGTLINGSDRTASTSGSFDGSTLRLEFKEWDAVLEARVGAASLDGTFTRPFKKTKLVRELHAQRAPFREPRAAAGGDVNGEWLLKLDDATRSLWRAQFRQKGNGVGGVLIPVTGDSGELAGRMVNGELTLSRFDGVRTLLLTARLRADGSLQGTLSFNSTVSKLSGHRADSGGPDASAYTRMRNPGEPLRFSFQDLNGVVVANTDERFRGKVVIVSITGSWCPNCHEEAPFLNELYERFHGKGLEVAALAFEYTGDVERDRRQLRLFASKYGVKYPILLAGTTEDAAVKLAQLENFGAYPTTIFIGRDGLVKLIHAGFDGPSTGARHTQLKREITTRVEELLSR